MSSNRHYFGQLPITRYNTPMHHILVSYINHQNNRNFSNTHLTFLEPTSIGEQGLVEVSVVFTPESGLSSTSPGKLTYKRQEIKEAVPNGMFIIHTVDVTAESIKQALLEHYGFFLDEGTYTVIETDSAGIETTPPDDIELSEDRWFLLRLNNTHLLFEGEVMIRRVASIALLGTTISRLLDLREYYQDVSAGVFPVELYTANFSMVLGTELGRWLYYINDTNHFPDHVASALSKTTGDPWVVNETPSPFNIAGYQIVYNGLNNDQYQSTDANYPYVLVIRLSEMCTNLQGCITLGYRNDKKHHPGYVGGRDIRPVGILKT